MATGTLSIAPRPTGGFDASATIIDEAGSIPTAAYKVDTSAGEMRGDVAAQWASRPDDQKFDTLSDLHAMKLRVWNNSRDVRLRSAELTAVHPWLDFEAVNPDGSPMNDAQERAEAQRRMSMLSFSFNANSGGDVQRIVEAAPTHWAFGQVCSYANVSKTEVRKYPTKIACDMLNWQLRYGGGTSADVKLWHHDEYAHGDGAKGTTEILAVQGPNYGRIADHEIVEALMGIAGDGKGDDPRFHWKAPGRLNWSNGTYDPEDIGPRDDRTFYGSDRDMFCFLVDDRRPIVVGKTRDGNDDLMFRGFYVQNSMVGARTLKLASFYLRGVCMNRNLWGVEKFNEITVRHTSGAPARWLQEARPALESFASGSDQALIEGVQRAKAKVLVEKDDQAIAYLRKSLAFSETAARAIVDIGEREEGRKPRTVWDFGQAITAHARSARNNDTRLDIELTARKVLDQVA